MKALFTLLAVLAVTSAVFASHDHPNRGSDDTNGTEPSSKAEAKSIVLEQPAVKAETGSINLFNFSLFKVVSPDSVPTISTFGGTDRFRKATGISARTRF